MNNSIIWNDEQIEKTIINMIQSTKQKTFPTHSEMQKFYGNSCLANAVKRNGGTKFWAKRLKLIEKESESKDGHEYELKCKYDILEKLSLESEYTNEHFPYDLLVERCVKIDVKFSRLYKTPTNSKFFSCNLEKKNQTCDIYVVYCKDGDDLEKVYIIPSFVLSGKCQLSIGEIQSKYDKYNDRWDIIEKYYEFMKGCI